jgi:hypothetical protein
LLVFLWILFADALFFLQRPATLLSVVNNLLTTRLDLDAQRLWMAIAHQVLEVYSAKVEVS